MFDYNALVGPTEKAPDFTPPAIDQIVQFSILLSTILIWRGTWFLWSSAFQGRLLSATLSSIIGAAMIICTRNFACLRSMLPPQTGSSFLKKFTQQLFQFTLIMSISLFWGGIISLIDLICRGEWWLQVSSFLCGLTSLIILNHSSLGKHGTYDRVAIHHG